MPDGLLNSILGRPLATPSAEDQEHLAIYEVMSAPGIFALTGDHQVVFGMRLECVYRRGFDVLQDDISQAGADAVIGLLAPETPMGLGDRYSVHAVNITRDFETNIIDGWDIQLRLWVGDLPPGNELNQDQEQVT